MKSKFQKSEDLAKIGSIPKMNTAPFARILGDTTPPIDATRVGEHRLKMALRNRFGDNYQNHPDAKYAMAHYNFEKLHIQTLAKNKLRSK